MNEVESFLESATEEQLRDFDLAGAVGWVESRAELERILSALCRRNHTYGTCVYAMSISAEATMQYVSHRLGMSGFQVSCADLDIIRRSRRMKYPFKIVDLGLLLYPQYYSTNHFQDLAVLLDENRDWLKEKAAELLGTSSACTEVRAHWEDLAAGRTPKCMKKR